MASCTGAPLVFGAGQAERVVEHVYDKARDAMIEKTLIRTPDGNMTQQSLCFRADPPSPIEKPMKDLVTDFPKYKWLLQEPVGIDRQAWEEMRVACETRQQAFGVCVSYPGFQAWMTAVEGGVSPLAYAEVDTPELLQEWFELDLANGTRAMELVINARPDYPAFWRFRARSRWHRLTLRENMRFRP